jgi:Tol biopolymer transport system component
MRPRSLISAATVAMLLLGVGVAVAPSSDAAFPGRNGRLVFAREVPAGDHTQTDLWSVRPDGTDLRRLTATPNRNEFGPTWNAAGDRIAFWRTKAPFGPGSIWVMDADAQHQQQLTHGFDARDPAWNPAGTRLVFTRIVGSDSDLWTMRASDGGAARALTSGPALDFEPAWAPGGRRIAFTRGSAQGDPGDVYLIDVASHATRRLTRSAAYDHQVNWGPGGAWLVLERDYDRSSVIVAVRADGSQRVRLTSGHFDTGPAFSPDGRRIAFGSDRGTALDDLWIMHSDGSHLVDVRKLRYSEGFPDWRPLPG